MVVADIVRIFVVATNVVAENAISPGAYAVKNVYPEVSGPLLHFA